MSYYSTHTIYRVASGQVRDFEAKFGIKEKLGEKKNLILKMKNAKIYTGRNSVHRLGKGLARQHLYMKRYGDFDG